MIDTPLFKMTTLDDELTNVLNINNYEISGYCRYYKFYMDIAYTAQDGDIFVEIGSFLGQSSAIMGHMIKYLNKDIKFHCVDLFKTSDFSDPIHFDHVNGDFYQTFLDNMKNANIDNIISHQMSSKEASRLFEDNSLKFVFLDASHIYEDVCNDIKYWWPKIESGGVLGGDDYDWIDVSLAVEDTLLKSKKIMIVYTPTYENQTISTWHVNKP